MKLLGKKVTLNGDNTYNYIGETRVVGKSSVPNTYIVELPDNRGWKIMDEDDTYIENYELPYGHSLMLVIYEDLESSLGMDSLKEGDHFWAKLDGKLAVFMYQRDGYMYVCGDWECGFSLSELEFVSKIDIPKGYTKKDLYYR